MKRIILLLTVALVMTVMMALAGPAAATIHPLANSECSADAADDTPADTQNPPGITGDDNATEAQPVISVSGNPTAADNAFKDGCPA
jgi:hypothetical protein